jgi:hypothetical protein
VYLSGAKTRNIAVLAAIISLSILLFAHAQDKTSAKGKEKTPPSESANELSIFDESYGPQTVKEDTKKSKRWYPFVKDKKWYPFMGQQAELPQD